LKLNLEDQNEVEKFLRTLSKIKEFEYRAISEYANDLIFAIDENFEIEHINKKVFQKLLGYHIDDLLRRELLHIIHPDDRTKLIDELTLLFGGQENIFTLRAQHKNGEYLWFEANGKIYSDGGEKKAILIARDITERKRAEEELKKAYNLLDVVKDIFAHDISGLLQNIHSATQLIEQDLQNPAKKVSPQRLKDLIMTIQTQINRANKLSSDVRKISKIEKSEFTLEKIELLELLRQAKDFILQSFPERKISIQIDATKKSYWTYGNELLMDVFENILINAVRYTTEETVEILIRISEEVSSIRIEFTDNGIGIPAHKKEQIFEARTDTSPQLDYVKGLGIGLSLVKKLVQKSHGQIWVEDRVQGDPAEGSKFIITLPKYNSESSIR
jgi:PAS domain S-box-containing protein